MKLFSITRVRRNTAFMVLLAWVFALASGVANACLLEARQTHLHTATAASLEAPAHAFSVLPGHAGTVADGVDEPYFKAPCLKVCDEGSRSFPNHGLKVAHTDPGPALLAVVLWRAAAPDVPAFRQLEGAQPATLEPPIRVRFPRLAI